MATSGEVEEVSSKEIMSLLQEAWSRLGQPSSETESDLTDMEHGFSPLSSSSGTSGSLEKSKDLTDVSNEERGLDQQSSGASGSLEESEDLTDVSDKERGLGQQSSGASGSLEESEDLTDVSDKERGLGQQSSGASGSLEESKDLTDVSDEECGFSLLSSSIDTSGSLEESEDLTDVRSRETPKWKRIFTRVRNWPRKFFNRHFRKRLDENMTHPVYEDQRRSWTGRLMRSKTEELSHKRCPLCARRRSRREEWEEWKEWVNNLEAVGRFSVPEAPAFRESSL